MPVTTPERWQWVPDYAGLYEVSDRGRVRSIERVTTRGRRIPSRILRTALSAYPTVGLYRDGRQRRFYVHRLVLAAFVGPCPPGMEGCHGDGDPLNANLTNLRWDWPSANNRDKTRHGTHNMSRRTHCPRGHVLAAPNLSAASVRAGRRGCLACTRSNPDTAYAQIMQGATTC